MSDPLTPDSEAAVAQAVREAASARRPLSVVGSGTRPVGRPLQTSATLSTKALSGITLLEPAEMVAGAKAGTPLRELEEALAKHGQRLAFEPMDHRPLLGTSGEPTAGGVAATNASGPRRPFAGAARDGLIGVRFVNGRGETIKNGGRVMKNVTGYDLVKLLAGSWGTLGVLTEVTFKTQPSPPASATLVYEGLDDAAAVALMTAATGLAYEVTGAAHLPAGLDPAHGRARTCLRFEGFPEQMTYRLDAAAAALRDHGAPAGRIEGEEAAGLWAATRDAAWLAEPRAAAVWRLSLPPKEGAKVVAATRAGLGDSGEARAFYDWAGGLVWLALDEAAGENDAGAKAIRRVVKESGGHATLIRGSAQLRSRIAVFEPPANPTLLALSQRVKASFDPERVLNPSLMHEGV